MAEITTCKVAYWLGEAARAANDGHPHAALAAFAYALLPHEVVAHPERARAEYPAEWAQIECYAAALGISEVLRRG